MLSNFESVQCALNTLVPFVDGLLPVRFRALINFSSFSHLPFEFVSIGLRVFPSIFHNSCVAVVCIRMKGSSYKIRTHDLCHDPLVNDVSLFLLWWISWDMNRPSSWCTCEEYAWRSCAHAAKFFGREFACINSSSRLFLRRDNMPYDLSASICHRMSRSIWHIRTSAVWCATRSSVDSSRICQQMKFDTFRSDTCTEFGVYGTNSCAVVAFVWSLGSCGTCNSWTLSSWRSGKWLDGTPSLRDSQTYPNTTFCDTGS